jgi:hypothetical protein
MTTTARQPDMQVPVIGELGQQWRQHGGQGESGLSATRQDAWLPTAWISSSRSSGRRRGRAERPLACRVQGPWRDALPARRRRDPVAHFARDSLTVQPPDADATDQSGPFDPPKMTPTDPATPRAVVLGVAITDTFV